MWKTFTFLPLPTLSAAGSVQFKKYIYIYNSTSLGTSDTISPFENFSHLENLTTYIIISTFLFVIQKQHQNLFHDLNH